MSKKLEYMVVRENANYGFQYQIDMMIEEGWEPLGGVQVSREPESGYSVRLYQAMIRKVSKTRQKKALG